MVKKGIMLGHNILGKGIQDGHAKFEVITKIPPPIFVRGVRTFLGLIGVNRNFINNFSKISQSLCKLLE